MSCAAHFHNLIKQLNTVIKGKWPTSLDGNALNWAQDHQPDLYNKWVALHKEGNELWLNNSEAEFKKISTEWGRVSMEIHKLYAMELLRREAA